MQQKPSSLQIKRAREVAQLIVDAHNDDRPIPVVQGIDAVNLADVLLYLEPLARRPEGNGGPMPPNHQPRPTVAGEVLPPHRRASHWKKPIEGLDK